MRQPRARPPEAPRVEASRPTSAAADGQLRAQVRRTVLGLLIYGEGDPDFIRDALRKRHGLEVGEPEARALVAEARAWQREQHAARRPYEREDAIDRLLKELPEQKGSARIAAEAQLAKILGVEAPTEMRTRVDLAPEVLAVLGGASKEEIARWVTRGVRAVGEGDR